ncbi:LuxR C-terminal-related transcriptional regulator [Mycolicibacterium sp. CBMA 226]|uniref:LuxR C-terminal-related transcriptional regulator n=1 Tax=Mycolicibacterium sp. CBMA 226 TaxID=2606611 RepID=UPI0013057793|nr:LuxR family transcriptional regulator [Mycolicibacterium sp. CBMA 226]MUL79299.1 AAA family ATPase [Mycolicibacterium sp. CBMA 226]
MRLKWPLTGRNEELAAIDAAMSDTDSCGVVIRGAAGVGKSRIAREALAHAAEEGCTTHWAVATSSARALPLGALATWVTPGMDGPQLVRLMVDALTSSSAGGAVIIGVDDVHLLDDLSAFVLHQIVRRRTAKLVLTLRDGETVPAGVQEVWSAGEFHRIDLQPLSYDETARLLHGTLGGVIDPAAGQRLWGLTHGNALYLHHTVEQEVTGGRLVPERGCWRWTGNITVAPALAELIESRMGALPTTVAEVIDILAVGEPMDIRLLAHVTDPAAIEDAETRSLITLDNSDGAPKVRLAHPLYGEVRRERAPAIRLRRLRGIVANTLAAGADRDDLRVLVRRATLALDSDLLPEPELFLSAARSAVQLLDMPLAERLARAAVDAAGGMPAQIQHAYCVVWSSRATEAQQELAALADQTQTDLDRARVATLRGHNTYWSLRQPTTAEAILNAADAAVSDPLAKRILAAERAAFHADLGRPAAAVQTAAAALAGQLPEQDAALASWAMVGGLAMLGRVGELETAAELGQKAATVAPNGSVLRNGLSYRHMIGLKLAGCLHDAELVARHAWHDTADTWFPFSGEVHLGLAHLAGGRIAEALSRLQAALTALEPYGEFGGWPYRCRLGITQALALAGDAPAARAAMTELDENQHPGLLFLATELTLARAWVAAAEGSLTEAVRIAHTAANNAREAGQPAYEVLAWQTAAQFGDGSGAGRLLELTHLVEGPRADLAARFASALGSGNADELVTVSTGFEEIGDLIAANDAAAHAALTYRRNDQRGSALTCSTRAEALAQECGAVTPALRQAAQPLPLTDREREIVRLLGQGLPSRAIAERLTLSTRTVEGHIYRAMAKTGTTNRDDLAALLRR